MKVVVVMEMKNLLLKLAGCVLVFWMFVMSVCMNDILSGADQMASNVRVEMSRPRPAPLTYSDQRILQAAIAIDYAHAQQAQIHTDPEAGE